MGNKKQHSEVEAPALPVLEAVEEAQPAPAGASQIVDYTKREAPDLAAAVDTCPKCGQLGRWFDLPAGGSLVGHVVIELPSGSASIDVGCEVAEKLAPLPAAAAEEVPADGETEADE